MRIESGDIPSDHKTAHEALSMSSCDFHYGWRGCDFIDVAKKAVGLTGQEHQVRLREIAEEKLPKVCSTCVMREWIPAGENKREIYG